MFPRQLEYGTLRARQLEGENITETYVETDQNNVNRTIREDLNESKPVEESKPPVVDKQVEQKSEKKR